MPDSAEITYSSQTPGLASSVGRLSHLDETVVCGLAGPNARGATAFAAGLARRLGWRLSLTPLPLGEPVPRRLEQLIGAARRERAALVVTSRGGAPGWLEALRELSPTAPCPLIVVPQDAPCRSLRTAPIVCGVAAGDVPGPTVRAAARLASAAGARLRQVVVDEREPARRLTRVAERDGAALLVVGAPREEMDEERVFATVLRESGVPVMIVPRPNGRIHP